MLPLKNCCACAVLTANFSELSGFSVFEIVLLRLKALLFDDPCPCSTFGVAGVRGSMSTTICDFQQIGLRGIGTGNGRFSFLSVQASAFPFVPCCRVF